MSGTSMAAPHVAGVMAVLLSMTNQGQGTTPAQMKTYLRDQ